MAEFNAASAVVQGLITVTGVTLGVVLTELAIRARDRRRSIERNTIRATILIPHVTVAISSAWDEKSAPRPDTSLGSHVIDNVQAAHVGLPAAPRGAVRGNPERGRSQLVVRAHLNASDYVWRALDLSRV
jgi:hypothetical protein